MTWKVRGSYTVEGTIIISLICLMVGFIAALGFYCHDRTVIQSTADELAMFGSLWSGRYMHPEIREVDYECLKNFSEVSTDMLEEKGYGMIRGKLFCGDIQGVEVHRSSWTREIQVKIQCQFQIGRWKFPYTAEAAAVDFHSGDFPRQKDSPPEEGENESGKPEG